MPENLTELAEAGYLPTKVDPACGAVVLARMAGFGFREVWFDDTAAEVDDTRTVPVSAFTDQFAERRPGEPLRLITHVSRCGSTLLANLLALRSTTMVLKEPDFVTIPARGIVSAADASADLVRGLLNYTCHAAAAADRTPVVKITSWTVPTLVACLHDAPDTTWLLQWRAPAEVVVSNAAAPSTWGQDTENGRAARRLAGDLGEDITGFYASTWARIVFSILSAEHLPRRTLDYHRLVQCKATALLETERWFGLCADELPPGFEQESGRYSKGPAAQAFEPAGAHRREELPPAAATQVAAVTRQALELLRREDHRLRLF